MPALAVFAAPGGALLLPILVKLLPFNFLPSAWDKVGADRSPAALPDASPTPGAEGSARPGADAPAPPKGTTKPAA